MTEINPVSRPLGWLGIVRMGLVQMSLGAIIVLTTSTLNRVMVVELGLLASLPGALVGLHYAIQVLRPRWGYGSDVGGRRTPWIIGGMFVLSAAAIMAAVATMLLETSYMLGMTLSVIAFLLIGCGVGASGTSLLVLLAVRVGQRRRPAAATIVWLMMIAGMAVTATVAGGFLDPFSWGRLVAVTSVVSAGAFVLTTAAIWGIEGQPEIRSSATSETTAQTDAAPVGFVAAFLDVWREPRSRQFALFVFVSMLAYSAQDLILEPFGGEIFGMTPGESTKLSGTQHGGVFIGMILVAILGTGFGRGRFGSMRAWAVGGCLASAVMLASLAFATKVGPSFPLQAAVFLLGVANGAFAVAAIGSMMGMVRQGKEKREGTRMGLWGAAQAIAFGVGGLVGTVALDAVRHFSGSASTAFTSVFALEAILFLVSAYLAVGISSTGRTEALGLDNNVNNMPAL